MAAADWISKALARLEILEQEREGLETEKSTTNQTSWSRDQARRLKRIEIEIGALYSKLEAAAEKIEADSSEDGELDSEDSASSDDDICPPHEDHASVEGPYESPESRELEHLESNDEDSHPDGQLQDSKRERREITVGYGTGRSPSIHSCEVGEAVHFNAAELVEETSRDGARTSASNELRSSPSNENRERAVAIEKLRASRSEGKSNGYAKSSSFASLATSGSSGIGVGMTTNNYSPVSAPEQSSRVQTAARAAARANTVEAMKANLRAKSRRTLQPLNTQPTSPAIEQASTAPVQITNIEQGEIDQTQRLNPDSSPSQSEAIGFGNALQQEEHPSSDSEAEPVRASTESSSMNGSAMDKLAADGEEPIESVSNVRASVDHSIGNGQSASSETKESRTGVETESYERELYDVDELEVGSGDEKPAEDSESVMKSEDETTKGMGDEVNEPASLAPLTVPEFGSIDAEDEGKLLEDKTVEESREVPNNVSLESTPPSNQADTIPEEFGILSPIAQTVHSELEVAEAQAKALEAALEKAKEVERVKSSAVAEAANQHLMAEQQVLEARRVQELAVQAELEAQSRTQRTQEAAQAVVEQLEAARKRLAYLQENAQVMEHLYGEVAAAEQRVESVKQTGDQAIEALRDANEAAQVLAMRAVEETETIHQKFEEAQSRAEEAVAIAEQATNELVEAQERFSHELEEAEKQLEQAKADLEQRFRQVRSNEIDGEPAGREEVSNSSNYDEYRGSEESRCGASEHHSENNTDGEYFSGEGEMTQVTDSDPVSGEQAVAPERQGSARTTQFKTQTQTQAQIQSRKIVRRRSDPSEIENPFAPRGSEVPENRAEVQSNGAEVANHPDVFAALVDESEEWSSGKGNGKWKWVAGIAAAIGILVIGVVATGGGDESEAGVESTKSQLEVKGNEAQGVVGNKKSVSKSEAKSKSTTPVNAETNSQALPNKKVKTAASEQGSAAGIAKPQALKPKKKKTSSRKSRSKKKKSRSRKKSK